MNFTAEILFLLWGTIPDPLEGDMTCNTEYMLHTIPFLNPIRSKFKYNPIPDTITIIILYRRTLFKWMGHRKKLYKSI